MNSRGDSIQIGSVCFAVLGRRGIKPGRPSFLSVGLWLPLALLLATSMSA
jgi:hypothetical protein